MTVHPCQVASPKFGTEQPPRPSITRISMPLHLAGVLTLAVLSVAILLSSSVPSYIYGHDIFIPLDGAWRILNGQRPHIDFFTGIGPVWYLIVAIGITVAGGKASGVGNGSAIASLVLCVWAYSIARRRLAGWTSIAFTIFVFLLSATPTALGDPSPVAFTFAMPYNKWGFALLSIVLIEVLTPERASFGGGFSTGAACAVLFFLKANFFLAAVALSITFAFNGNTTQRRLAGIAAGLGTVAFPMFAYLRFDAASVWHDLRTAASAKSGAVTIAAILASARARWIELTGLLVEAALLLLYSSATSFRTMRAYLLLLACIGVFICGLVLGSTNGPTGTMPLNAAAALVFGSQFWRCSTEGAGRRSIKAAATICACLLILNCIGTAAQSFLLLTYKPGLATRKPEATFHSARLAGFVTFGPANRTQRPTDGKWLAEYVNDGLELLENNSGNQDSVVTFDYVNPFSFALQRPPNAGGATWLAWANNYTDSVKPEATRVFGTATIVMFPKWPSSSPEQFEGMMRSYGAFLRQNYRPVAESRWWILERRL
jgi:hypothetical protein